ncbi:transporter substrate-binding domain-containing protein [Jiangella aurantiaca]|uniref:Transporter substrate-binding domain-containing protein n=1 Tax=Jiangella aurantiaca TaxID=2530373 RepID=A0A4R5ACH0_9ACTN|nr:ABC transporter substrate-binding protein [Jiangella aurantiaca]TDD68936.1 transporter substrate-binding domain-containing protein [Jiangella aurantiaca]
MTARAPRRRRFAAAVAAVTGVALLSSCALESSGPTTSDDGLAVVRVGYLHTVAVDSHMWLGTEEAIFAEHGVQLEPVAFDTGTALSQALSGGSVDVAIMGAVLSNFPAQGAGTVFLANDVEFDTAQLWVDPSSGIRSVADLAGQQVMTATGTTAHVYLHNALKQEGVDPADVRVVNADMPSAVTAFVAGQVPAVVLWVPFDETVRNEKPDAELISSAKDYYPESSIIGGWVANDDFYESDHDTLVKIAAAWLDVNHRLLEDTEAAMTTVHEAAYADSQELEDTLRQFEFSRLYPNDEWARMYESGELEDSIGAVEQIFVELGGIDEYVEPGEFVDTGILLDAYAEWKEQ